MLLVFRAHAQLAISAGGIQASLVFMVLFSAASCAPARSYVHARMFIGRPLTQPVVESAVAEDKITIVGKPKTYERLCRENP